MCLLNVDRFTLLAGLMVFAIYAIVRFVPMENMRAAIRTINQPKPAFVPFIYYALPVVGNRLIREHLIEYCEKTHNVSCLSLKSCGFIRDDVFADCTKGMQRGQQIVHHIHPVQMTSFRLESGCCLLLKEGYHGVILPWRITNDGEKLRSQIYETLRSNVKHFTIWQDPSEQFVFMHDELRRFWPMVPPLITLIEMLHPVLKGRHGPDYHLQPYYQILTNAQSKQLGWSGRTGDGSMEIVDQVLARMSVIGTLDQIPQSWLRISSLLNQSFSNPEIWSPPPNFHSKMSKSTENSEIPSKLAEIRRILSNLTEDQQKKLRDIQYVDYSYYRRIQNLQNSGKTPTEEKVTTVGKMPTSLQKSQNSENVSTPINENLQNIEKRPTTTVTSLLTEENLQNSEKTPITVTSLPTEENLQNRRNFTDHNGLKTTEEKMPNSPKTPTNENLQNNTKSPTDSENMQNSTMDNNITTIDDSDLMENSSTISVNSSAVLEHTLKVLENLSSISGDNKTLLKSNLTLLIDSN